MPYANIINSACCILCGGASTRMGQDKASLTLATGQTLLDYTLNKFQDLTNFICLSGTNTVNTPNYPHIPDQFSQRYGPVAGIISTVLWLNKYQPQINGCFFIPIDMPYLSVDLLRQLYSSQHAICHFTYHPLPLYLKIDAACLEICHTLLSQIPQNNGYAVKRLIEHFLDVQLIETQQPELLRNINYYYQWEQAQHEIITRSK